jgi:integrase
MSKRKWNKTAYPGVRYREHGTRKHGINFDRYFAIRYRFKGKTYESGLGWTSEGWTAKKAAMELAELKRNAKTGTGPLTLAEKRDRAQAEKETAERLRMQEERESLTFGQYFKNTYHPAAAVSKKHNTWKQEGSYFRVWLKPNIGRMRLMDLRPLHIEKIKRAMVKNEKAPRTIQAVLALARQVWNHARNNDIVSGDWPGRSVKAGRFDNRRMRFLTHDECEALISKLRETSPQVADMALLSLDTGMRAGEIFSLIWENVNIDAGQIQVMDTKGGRNRTAYMTERVKSMFQALEDDGGIVFPSNTGGKIGQISNTVVKAIKTLGMNDGITDPRNKATFHSLRHTFASRLVANGTDLYTVKELMGHSTLAMTERYSHVSNESLELAVKRMEKATVLAGGRSVTPLRVNENHN